MKCLPSQYSELATTLRTNESLNFMDVVGMLLSEEKQPVDGCSRNDVAFAMKNKKDKSTKGHVDSSFG